MGTFEQLQRKSSTSSTRATSTSSLQRLSRSFEPTPVPTFEQVYPDQQTQPRHSTRLRHSLDRIPIIPPERENHTGMPDNLKAGIEILSGLSIDDVKVRYNSSKPAQLQALAYTQGTDIHVGPCQEKHLAHEAWHVVQQKQGRVKPTLQVKGVAINDNQWLESEADMMGTKAVTGQFSHEVLSRFTGESSKRPGHLIDDTPLAKQGVVQCNEDGPRRPWPPGLRRRKPAPKREREPEREFSGPSMRTRLEHYIADIQARPAFYAQKGLIGSVSFILGQMGLNLTNAFFSFITGLPALKSKFMHMSAEITSGKTRNAAADATSMAMTIAGIIEKALGTHGMIAYATTGALYGAGFAREKEKKE